MGGPFEGKYRNASVLHDVAYDQKNQKVFFFVADKVLVLYKYLLTSRAHPDRAGGLARMKKDTGAQIVATSADKPLLAPS